MPISITEYVMILFCFWQWFTRCFEAGKYIPLSKISFDKDKIQFDKQQIISAIDINGFNKRGNISFQ